MPKVRISVKREDPRIKLEGILMFKAIEPTKKCKKGGKKASNMLVTCAKRRGRGKAVHLS